MMEHLGEDAELYSLGLLDEDAARIVERHIAECSACAERVSQAQGVAASLAAALPAEEPSPALERRLFAAARPRLERKPFDARVWGAIAAAFVIGLLPSIWYAARQAPPSPHTLAAVAMIESHFNHAQFAGAGAPPAKVIYARDRSWLYVMVTGSHRYDLYAIRGNAARLIGSTLPQPTSSELFVTQPGALDALQLRDGTTIVESAKVR